MTKDGIARNGLLCLRYHRFSFDLFSGWILNGFSLSLRKLKDCFSIITIMMKYFHEFINIIMMMCVHE